jgi:very-short-patch-repair endonuclease
MPHTPVDEAQRTRATRLRRRIKILERPSRYPSSSGASGTPLPSPPPQGGREQIYRAAAPESNSCQRQAVIFGDASTVVRLPPPLRGRVGERGMPHTPVDEAQRARAKQLRRTMTRAETLLWRHLKANRLAGLGFRRQSPMGNYIADFVSHSCKLVVEVDGESHDFEERIRRDDRRDQWFASRGYRVLRFTNDDVTKNLEGVVMAIGQAAEQAAPFSLTLPRKGGGNSSADGAR